MKIVKRETNQGNGNQTLMYDEMSRKYFVVSSIQNDYANETYIFESDSEGNITNWSEVWRTRPSNHTEVVDMLVSGEISYLDLDMSFAE